MCEEERERLENTERMRCESERLEAERIEREKDEKRLKIYNQMAEHLLYETVVICFPHTIHPEYGCTIMTDLEVFCRAQMMYVATQNKVTITNEIFEEVYAYCTTIEKRKTLFILIVDSILTFLLGILQRKLRTNA